MMLVEQACIRGVVLDEGEGVTLGEDQKVEDVASVTVL
jgi:hypothetical protein